MTFLVTSRVFPVATLWGTFAHASGPLLAGLIVAAIIDLYVVVARTGTRRNWTRANLWLGPLVALAMVAPFGLLQLSSLSSQAETRAERIRRPRSPWSYGRRWPRHPAPATRRT